MSFILVPKNGEEVQVNAWNWRPTLELLRCHGVVDDGEACDRLAAQACGGRLTGDDAERAARVVDEQLASMKPGERMRADLTVTAGPRPTVMFSANGVKPDVSDIDRYSASFEWLVTFRDFCRTCGGFDVY
jgi:hypothetical protein